MNDVNTILLVDDNADNLQVLAELLEREGYHVRPALSGAIALQSMELSLPDLILLDIRMPEMDGYEVCRRLKSSEATRGIPVIFISAVQDLEEKLRAFRVGGVDYVVKPFQEEEVIARVRTHLQLAQMADLKREVQERKLAEQVLRQSEERFRLIFEQSQDAIFNTSPGGVILDANSAACKIFGKTVAELCSMGRDGVMDITDPRLAVAVAERERSGLVIAELTCVRGNGELFPAEVSSFVSVEKPQLSFVIVRDISERKRAEEEKRLRDKQYQQTQKLESLGVLAGGIAHEFNNILAVIMGYCSLVKMDYATAEEYIPTIEKAAERAAAMVRQMLAYAGKAQLVKTQVNMAALLDDMVRMLIATLPQNVAVQSHLAADIPLIYGDASQLKQIVMNLMINAAEAIGEGQGKIDVSLTNTTVAAGQSEPDYNGKAIAPGRYVCLQVSDNGCGMDVDTQWRIFEPFYTTKFAGRGLGMSAVLGIVGSHGGALQMVSQPDVGTTFKVYLLFQSGEFSPESLLPESSESWKGSGTILLVEDEEDIMRMASTMLKALGFAVVEATNGQEAWQYYQQNAENISLVVTDIGMPVMDGYALFHELKRNDPKLPIVIASGFGDAVVGSRIPRQEMAGFVTKPFRFEQLQSVIKEVVEGGSS